MRLREYTSANELAKIEKLYVEAFPEVERKPFEVMCKGIGAGVEMLAIEENGQFLAMAIMLIYGSIALLDYFAVCPTQRGGGIGSRALELIKERYEGKAVLIEIEDTDEICEDRPMRIRRKGFYLRNGMVEMPYKVWFYGTKMQVLTSGKDVSFESHYEVYKMILDSDVAKNIELVEYENSVIGSL